MSRALALALVALPCLAEAHAEHCGQLAALTVRSTGITLELDLTPGLRVADAFVADLDQDHDGAVSRAEEGAFQARVSRDLDVRVDGLRQPLSVDRVTVPAVALLRTGEATIALRAHTTAALPGGTHRVCITNRFGAFPSAHAINAFAGDHTVTLAAPSRTDEGRSLCVVATVVAPPQPRAGASLRTVLLVAGALLLAGFVGYRLRP